MRSLSVDNKIKVVYKDLSYKIINAVYEVHNALGCGFLEKVYENALIMELKERKIKCENKKKIKVFYKGKVAGIYEADILVENCIILELKVVDKIDEICEAQLLNYLKATGLKLGIIINFKYPKLEYKRMVL